MTVRENLELGSFRRAAQRERGELARARVRAVPGRAREARRARRRAVGRPAADGRDRPRADGAAAAAAARRAVARPRAAIVLAMFRRDPRDQRRGTAVLLVEQNVAMALEIATRAYLLEEGRIVADGTPDEVFARPELRRAYLGVEALATPASRGP
jgi:branched-chain amino acid transport system ATP-binding protein